MASAPLADIQPVALPAGAGGRPSRWTTRESATLASLWPDARRPAILAALPGRTWDACRIRAKRLGVRRVKWHFAAGHHRGWTTAQARQWSAVGGAAHAAVASVPGRDLTGLRFGRLVVQHYVGRKWWQCRCDCGETTHAIGAWLVRAKHPVQSCGCLRRETSARLMRAAQATRAAQMRARRAA